METDLVFIDTNVFKSNSFLNRKIIDLFNYAEKGEIKIILTTIVVRECEKHFELKAREIINKLIDINKNHHFFFSYHRNTKQISKRINSLNEELAI